MAHLQIACSAPEAVAQFRAQLAENRLGSQQWQARAEQLGVHPREAQSLWQAWQAEQIPRPKVYLPTEQTAAVSAIACAADGRQWLTGHATGQVCLWSLSSGQRLHAWQDHHGPIQAVAFSPDGQQIVACADHTAIFWRRADHKKVGHWQAPSKIFALCYAPEGEHLLIGCADGQLRLFNIASKQVQNWAGHSRAIKSVAYSADGRYGLSAGLEGDVRLWSMATGKVVQHYRGHTGMVSAVAFAANGQPYSAGVDATLRHWHLTQPVEYQRFRGHVGAVTALASQAVHNEIVSAGSDHSLRIWNLEDGTAQTLPGHANKVTAVTCSPTGDWIFSASRDGTARLWARSTAEECLRVTSFSAEQWLACTPAGDYNASAEGADYLRMIAAGGPQPLSNHWRTSLYKADLALEPNA